MVSSRVARLWHAPLWAHVVALAAVLVVLGLLAKPGQAFTSDEGAALLQARLIDDTGSWIYDYPLSALGLGDEARPFVRADQGDEGLAPYVKHPLYVELLRVADRLGPLGLVATSALGTLLAAVGAALVARRFDRDLARPSLWVVGVASPLLFDSFLLLAHTLAAAGAVLAVWAALHTLDRTGWARAGWAVTLGVLVAFTAAMRSEGLLLVPAFVAAAAWALWRSRRASSRVGPLAVALAAVVGGAGVWLAERAVMAAVIGERVATSGERFAGGWVSGRLEGFWATWMDTSYGANRAADLVLSLAAVLVVGAAVVFRVRPDRSTLVSGLLIAAAACYVVRLLADRPGSIPGLAVAFPIGWAGLWLMNRRAVADPERSFVTVVALVGTVAVLFTQYARGGGIEWGGRFFAFLVPIATPLLLVAIAGARRTIAPSVSLPRTALAAALVSTVALAVLGVGAVRRVHDQTQQVGRAIDSLAATAADPTDPVLAHPVVVSWNRLLPQILYDRFDDYEWVAASRGDIGGSLDLLGEAGVERVIFVSPDLSRDAELVDGWQVVERSTVPGSPQEVVVLEREVDR